MVKIRDGKVINRPIYVAIGVTVKGERDILGLWAGEDSQAGEGAKFWQQVLTEIRNRGVEDILMLVCDGLKGLPASVSNVWPNTIVQTCVVHLLRNSFFRYAPRQVWDKSPRTCAHLQRRDRGGGRATGGLRRGLGPPLPGHHPALALSVGRVRSVPAVRRRDPQDHLHDQRDRVAELPLPARGERPWAFPDRAGCDEVLYLVTRSLDPTGRGRAKWVVRWKPALDAFANIFEGRLTPASAN